MYLMLPTGTRLLELERRGKPGELIVGGDYDYNDGSGGAAILDHRDGHSWLPDGVGALVVRWGGQRDRAAQFGVRMKEYTVSCVFW